MQYNVKTIRAAGVECKWSHTRAGAPIIFGRKDGVGGGKWYVIDDRMWKRAQLVGVAQAFEEHNALGAYFYVPA